MQHRTTQKEAAHSAAHAIQTAAQRGRTAAMRVVAGFDGFVDTVAHAVKARAGTGDNYERVRTIGAFAQRVADAADASTNIELAVKRVVPGGNGPHMAGGLGALGVRVDYVGAVGNTNDTNEVHPVFDGLTTAGGRTYPAGKPGQTDAVEFDDGKVMLGKTHALDGLTWETVLDAVGGKAAYDDLIRHADLLCACNWTMLPHATNIWRRTLQGTIATLAQHREAPAVFADLADPAKRTDAAINELLGILTNAATHTDVVLGCNAAECARMLSATGAEPGAVTARSKEELAQQAQTLARKIGVTRVFAHAHRWAADATTNNRCSVDADYTPTPACSTGAGDHANAGYAMGMLLGLQPEATLAAACAVAGWRVRNQRAPTTQQLVEYLQRT